MEEILKIDLQGFKATYNAKWSEEEDVCNLNNVKQVNGVLFNGDGEILIVNVVGNWQLPGGHLEVEESYEDGLRRENLFLSGCSVGFTGLAVLSDGTVLPCRRLPIPIGNISEGIVKLVTESPVMQELRDLTRIKQGGGCCNHANYCRGCRAVAYAVTGDYMAKDPMCFKELIRPEDIRPRVIRR
ncbi:SPASM domain-containing protein [Candidatus Pacearchaeota archaeon]|nr:SPASM domain-containing protein [Candidatus Pacearchaeota archaeon]